MIIIISVTCGFETVWYYLRRVLANVSVFKYFLLMFLWLPEPISANTMKGFMNGIKITNNPYEKIDFENNL